MHHFSGQHHLADNFLGRIDGRVKLVSTLAILVMVISCKGMGFPLLVGGLSLGLALAMGVRPGVLALRFAEPLFIAAMVLLLKLFFTGRVPLFSFHMLGCDIVGHRDGLLAGARVASRICGAVSLVALLGFCTSFTELMAALSWLRVPRGLIEVALFAWRYLFVLLDDAQVVYAAQKNRLGYAGCRRGLRSFGTLAGALMIKAFDSSQTVTTAMVQRGYDGTMPLLKHRPFRVAQLVAVLLVVTGLGIIWSL